MNAVQITFPDQNVQKTPARKPAVAVSKRMYDDKLTFKNRGKVKRMHRRTRGIVKFDKKDVYVIEATPSDGIIQTLLYEFIQKAEKRKGRPLIAVGRVKPEFQYIVPLAVENAGDLLGRPYDYAYEEGNDAYYCSELIRFAYLDSLRNPIFPAIAMTFKNRETGETEAYWTKHFAGLQQEIPEGKPGTNPADMAKSPVIDIVHTYY